MDKYILIVEDEVQLRNNIETYLSDLGYNVYTADKVPDALEYCKKYKPDVIILDVYLLGEPGPNLSKKIYDNPMLYGRPKIIAISGALGEAFIMGDNFRKKYSIHTFLKKPFELSELDEIISHILKS